jgi:hypothetical protein
MKKSVIFVILLFCIFLLLIYFTIASITDEKSFIQKLNTQQSTTELLINSLKSSDSNTLNKMLCPLDSSMSKDVLANRQILNKTELKENKWSNITFDVIDNNIKVKNNNGQERIFGIYSNIIQYCVN